MAEMKRLFLWFLKLLISFGILYYILSTIPLTGVIESIVSVKLSFIIIASLIILLTIYIDASGMKILTDKQGLVLSRHQIIVINLSSRFYGLFLPGSLGGGVARIYKFSQPENKWSEALASITFNRLIGTIAVVVVGFSFWLLAPKAHLNYLAGLSLLTILVGLFVMYFLIFDAKVSSFLRRYLGEINYSVMPGILSKITKLVISASKYHSLSQRSLLYVFSLSLMSQLLGIMSFYLFALSLGINISFLNIGWARSVIVIISMLPLTFSGLGVREGSLVLLLQPYGVSATDAVALSFLFFARVLILGGIGGLFEARSLFFNRNGSSEVKEEVSI